ncbi:MAG TPA: SpoIIE family protein phosphatase [Thermoanaerobaculia bacterium]|nr:SpoIIE family protein phosphatase [Thermoanaerobaculia bacterium]
MKRPQRILFTLIGLSFLALLAWVAHLGLPVFSVLAGGFLAGVVLLVAVWATWRILRAFLWRVGRRLAFSYFLIGVLPIPMVLLVGLLAAYILSGFFLGHLYRDSIASMEAQLSSSAEAELAHFSGGLAPDDAGQSIVFGYYRSGKKVSGDRRTPPRFPAWLESSGEPRKEGLTRTDYVAMPDGKPTLAVALRRGDSGIVALFVGDLEAAIHRSTGIEAGLYRSDQPQKAPGLQIHLGSRELAILPVGKGGGLLASRFAFRTAAAGSQGGGQGGASEKLPLSERPIMVWSELSGPLKNLDDGTTAADYVAASLSASPRIVANHLFSAFPEVDGVAWGSLFGIALLLFEVYLVAVIMALFIIFGLSRAVNRLTSATARVRGGDFSARIPVRRRDQIGDLQRSFNSMAENLEGLVANAAHSEAVEKELAIARDLQQSLLPAEIPRGDHVEFATLFQPSAAIGGDYFDILRIDDERIAVVIADVSGHGLPTGLRMAMLKAALQILVEEAKGPEEILHRLDRMVRTGSEQRSFVTSTIASLNLTSGTLELTNAGHPPTYLLSRGEVREIALPSSPLGALGDEYGSLRLSLRANDIVVWLSDGLIEAADSEDESFGYVRIVEALRGPASSAAAVRDRLLTAVDRFTGGRMADDDRTLVVMRYLPGKGGSATTPRLA